MDRDITQLINGYTGKPVIEEVNMIKSIRGLVTPPDFIIGFGACNKEIFDEIIRYMARELNIPPPNALESFNLIPLISRGIYDLKEQIKGRIPEWNSLPGNTLIVTSTGFEKMPNYRQKSSALQAQGIAHIFTQAIKEDAGRSFENRELYYSSLNKVVILVTHIGHSAGKEAYDYAVVDADRRFRGNGFQDFNFEVKD